jgi:hypothetical protein
MDTVMALPSASKLQLAAALRAALAAASVVAGTAVAGCGPGAPAGPPTVPVQGKIVFTKGGDVFKLHDTQGVVEFESVDQPGIKAYGTIEQDGSFSLGTKFEGGSKPGAVTGEHRVRLNLDETAQKLVAPQFLSFERSKLTVTVPSTGDIVIQVWR